MLTSWTIRLSERSTILVPILVYDLSRISAPNAPFNQMSFGVAIEALKFGLEFLTFLVWYKVAFANFGKDWDKIISVSLRLLSVVSIY